MSQITVSRYASASVAPNVAVSWFPLDGDGNGGPGDSIGFFPAMLDDGRVTAAFINPFSILVMCL